MMEIKDLTQNVYEYLKNQGLEVDKVSEKILRLPRKFDVDSCFFSTFNSIKESAIDIWLDFDIIKGIMWVTVEGYNYVTANPEHWNDLLNLFNDEFYEKWPFFEITFRIDKYDGQIIPRFSARLDSDKYLEQCLYMIETVNDVANFCYKIIKRICNL